MTIDPFVPVLVTFPVVDVAIVIVALFEVTEPVVVAFWSVKLAPARVVDALVPFTLPVMVCPAASITTLDVPTVKQSPPDPTLVLNVYVPENAIEPQEEILPGRRGMYPPAKAP